jgi:hypothetical protein
MPKQVKAYDDGRVKYALDQSPKVFAEELAHWQNKERVAFLGREVKKQESGGSSIRGFLMGKSRFGRPGAWSHSIVGQFVSYTQDKGTLHPRMTMEFARKSPLIEAMEMEESGGGVTSGRFMPVPIFQNLAQIGVVRAFYRKFQEMAHDEQLIPVHPSGRPDLLYWFYKRNGHNMPLFVGRKSSTIKKQFDFHRAWDRRASKAVARGEQAIYRATRRVERMIKEGNANG